MRMHQSVSVSFGTSLKKYTLLSIAIIFTAVAMCSSQ